MLYKNVKPERGQTVPLGNQFEDNVRTIVFDLSDFRAAFGDGIATVLYQLPTDTDARARVAVQDGDELRWTITAADTQVAECGKAVLRWAPLDGGEARSVCFDTIVRPSLRTAEGEVPEPEKGWYESVLEAADAVRSGVDRAENAAKDAEESLQELKEGIASGEFNGKDGKDGYTPVKGVDYFDGKDGKDGSDYVLTDADREEIAGEAAGKLQPTITELSEDLSKKATNPDNPVVGQWSRVKEIGADGQPVWETAPLPIASGGNKVGVVSFNSSYGTNLKEGFYIGIEKANNTEVTNRVDYKPITPKNLDYAVKAAMCDGKGAAWSSEEQAAARERLGIGGKFELIEEFTTTEDITVFERTAEPNGAPYAFSKMLVLLKNPNAAYPTSKLTLFNNIGINKTVVLNQKDIGWSRYINLFYEIKNGRVFANGATGSNELNGLLLEETASACGIISAEKFEKLRLYAFTITSGTTIEIYAVRA